VEELLEVVISMQSVLSLHKELGRDEIIGGLTRPLLPVETFYEAVGMVMKQVLGI
jgi:hypothetical protein